MEHDFEYKEVCPNGNSRSGCSNVKVHRILNGTECHGYMDYCLGNHPANHTKQWSQCSVQDLKAYAFPKYCGPFCRRCREGLCLKPLSGKSQEGREIYSDACDILPVLSSSTEVCDPIWGHACDPSSDDTSTKQYCDACIKALGLDNPASWDCYYNNPIMKRCNRSSHAETVRCVEALCSSTTLSGEINI